MAADEPRNPLDDPQYLRRESRRLNRIIEVLSDPDAKKKLAAHALYLAQRAEALERRKFDRRLDAVRLAPDGPRTLRELAGWYRCFAERAGGTAIGETRLQMAANLEAEAASIERRQPRLDPDQRGGRVTD